MMQHTDWLDYQQTKTISTALCWSTIYSYLSWYETWNWEHKWRKYFMYIMFIPIDSMEKCINLNVKFLTSVTLCIYRWWWWWNQDAMWYVMYRLKLKTKNRLKQMKKFVIQRWLCYALLLFRFNIKHEIISIPVRSITSVVVNLNYFFHKNEKQE